MDSAENTMMEKQEDKFSGFSLPNEELILVLNYLRVEDVKSCRSVCRQWYLCCEDISITRKEDLVFRSPAYSTFEINEILINHQRSHINLKLINVDLKTLNLEKLGHKIRELKIVNCFVNEAEIMTKLFFLTPDMMLLEMSLDSSFGLEYSILGSVLNSLERRDFVNKNLKTLNFRGYGCRNENEIVQVIRQLCALFPCVSSFHHTGEIPLKKVDPKNLVNYTESFGDCRVNFEELDQTEPFISLSKLKTLSLHATFSFESHRSRSVTSYSQCIAHLKELDELDLYIYNDDIEKALDDEVETGKMLTEILLQVFRSCKKLTKLTYVYSTYSNFVIQMDQEDAKEFHKLLALTNIRELRTPPIKIPAVDGLSSDYNFGKLRKLSFEDTLGSSQTIDFVRTLMESSNLTYLYIRLRMEANESKDLSTIFELHKNLRSLEVCITSVEGEKFKVTLSNSITHEKLENFSIDFWTNSFSVMNTIVEDISKCSFPNLSTFDLRGEPGSWWNSGKKSRSYRLKKTFLELLKKMKALKEIYLGFCSMDIEDCMEICKSINKLQFIEWSCPVKSIPVPKKIIQLFENAPNLNLIHVYQWRNEAINRCSDSVIYYYCRSKKSLYECDRIERKGFYFNTSLQFEGSPPYKFLSQF